jgi:uncharacterized protein YukE
MTSNKVPYILAGSAVGGAVGYLILKRSGSIPDTIEGFRTKVEGRSRDVSGQLHGIVERAKRSVEEGQRVYQESQKRYQEQLRSLEGRNDEISTTVHQTVDNLNKTAYTVEQSVLDPVFEILALASGTQRFFRTLFGRRRLGEGGETVSFYKSERVTG